MLINYTLYMSFSILILLFSQQRWKQNKFYFNYQSHAFTTFAISKLNITSYLIPIAEPFINFIILNFLLKHMLCTTFLHHNHMQRLILSILSRNTTIIYIYLFAYSNSTNLIILEITFIVANLTHSHDMS